MHRSILAFLSCAVFTAFALGQGVPDKYKPAVKKGLAWLVKEQKADGSWPVKEHSPVTATAFAGLALLAEGSTTTKGAHAEALARAVDWMIEQGKKRNVADGLIGSREQRVGYMESHAAGLLFLACAYAVEDKEAKGILVRARRSEMLDTIKRGVAFTAQAQATNGGWFFVSAKEGKDTDTDVGSITIAQIHALRAAQLVGIEAPKATIDKAFAYLKRNTGPNGGINFREGPQPSERNGLSAAAVACAYPPGDYAQEHVKRWLKHAESNFTFAVRPVKFGTNTPDLLHGAIVVHGLGEKGYVDLFEKESKQLKWSQYRELAYDNLARSQVSNGSFPDGGENVGLVYRTAACLFVLQLDNEAVPIFSVKKKR